MELENLSRVLTPRQENKVRVTCDECGVDFEALNLARWTRRRCDTCIAKMNAEEEAERQEQAREMAEHDQARRIHAARIPAFWKDTTFASSDAGINKGAFVRCRKYAETFNPQTSPSLFLYSEKHGTGKTHLAVCIANHVLHEKKCRVRYQKARDLMLDIRRTYSDKSEGDEADILDTVLAFDLLVLDDVGIGRPSEWLTDTYWTVFDRRLEAGLPVVVTANCPLSGVEGADNLGDRIGFGAAGRLRKMCGENVIEFKGKDLR